jgi:cytochrome b561/polyisoprenoid-binding protein YceI
MTANVRQRYTAVAIVLHWAIALAIFAMIPLGWWMHDAAAHAATQAKAVAAYQLHKSIGLTILALSLARLGWRLMHAAPPLPAHMPAWEKFGARASHWLFYFLIIAMPFTGWLYVSTGWSANSDRPLEVPTLYFNLFRVPHLFGLSHLANETRAALSHAFMFTHSKFAWVMIGLAALHVAAALKHHFFDQDDVLVRMIPGLKPLAPTPAAEAPEPGRRIILAVGLALILIAGGTGLTAFQHLGESKAPPPRAKAAAPEPAPPQASEAAAPAETAPTTQAASAPTRAAASAPAAASGAAPAWTVNADSSAITFTGTHAGAAFEGHFETWSAVIRFDPDNLAASSATVTIDMGSVEDGVPLHEQSLPEPEWFDSANFPDAVFRTTSFRAAGAGRYEAVGTLTLKGHDIPITLPFSLSIRGDRAVMDGRVDLDRKRADLGQTSDPDAEWVSPTIAVIVHVEAARAS